MSNFDLHSYFKSQYINEAYSLPNSYEMGKEEDAKILISNIEKAIGKIDDGFGSGGYNGRDGYYLKVYSLKYWEDKEVNAVKKAIELTNKQTEKYNFEFHDTTDFETDIDDDRTWPASISFFVVPKESNESLNESYDYDEVAQSEFGMDYDQLGSGEKEWVRDEIDNMSMNEMDMNDPVLMKMRANKSDMAKRLASIEKFEKDQEQKIQNAKRGGAKEEPLRKLANIGKIAFLEKEREQLMRDMEQEAEPEGGSIADEYGSKLNRIDKAIAKLKGRKEMTYDQAIAEGHSLEDKDIKILIKAFDTLFGNPDWKESSEFRRIIQNLIDTNDAPGIQEIAETIKLGEGMIEEELCAKGKAYRKRRMAAGEKSSAYLSGRAVKVCKGQMSGKKKKK